METKSERQLETERIVKQLQIPASLMTGIVIPESSDITAFLTGYKNDIEMASKSQGKKPNTFQTPVTGTKQEQEHASCLLNEIGIDGSAKIGETNLQYNQRRQNENPQ